MKTLPIIATVLALSVAGGGIYYYQKKSSRTASAVKKMQDQPKTRKPVVWRDIASPVPTAAPAGVANDAPAPQPPAVTPAPTVSESGSTEPEEPDVSSLSIDELCAADWQQAASVELGLLRHQLAQGDFAMTPDCARLMYDANQGGDLGWFVAQCQPAAQIQIENRDRCVNLAMVYRAFAIGKVMREPEQLADVEMSALANILTRNMTSLREADSGQLDQSIAVANEIISREPNAYGAYKAKAVSMILKEARFKAGIDEEEFDETLAEMASFETFDPTFSLREESPGPAAELTEGVSSPDPDIIRMPFLRQMATGDYQALIEEAEDFIGEYPESPVGYHFLAQGLWRSGEKTEALEAIRTAMEQDTENVLLPELFEKAAERPAIDYLSDIRVEIDSEPSM